MSTKVIASLVVLGVLFGGSFLYTAATEGEVTATVTKSENDCRGKDRVYIIFTDQEVLKNDDSLWYLKYNSSDFYNEIKVGKKYHFTVYGWRVPFLSWYRNVVDYEEIP